MSCNPSTRAAVTELDQNESQMRETLPADLANRDVENHHDDGQVADMSFALEEDSVVHTDDSVETEEENIAQIQEDARSDVDIIMEQDDDSWGVGSFHDADPPVVEGYPGEALAQFKKYVREVRDTMLPFDRNERASIELMYTLMKKKATLDTYPELMKWHIKNYPEEVPKPAMISREKIIKKLAKRYNMPTKTVKKYGKDRQEPELLKKKTIILPSSGAKVNIIHHDARDQVVSLLTDPRFSDDDFLHFDDDPLAPPPQNIQYLEDINTGESYIETYRKLINKPGKQMLVPILLYIDGAVTGQFNALEVAALKITLGIFKKRARDREYAWRTLGYVPNYTQSASRGKKILQESLHAASHLLPTEEEEGIIHSSDEDDAASVASRAFRYDDMEEYELHTNKAQDYHRILAKILHSYHVLQEHGMVWDYKYQGKLYKNLELVFFIAFVKCDTDEADKLCGSYRSRGRNVSQLCRYCTVPTMQSDCHYLPRRTVFKTTELIQRLVEKGDEEKLKTLSQQNIQNAFHPLRFGLHNKAGIHGACPMEMLHHILLGIFKYVRDCFLFQVGQNSQHAPEINGLAMALGKFFARQSERDLPKTSFAKGIFEGKLTGKEYTGVLLLIAAILQTAKGRSILKSVRKGHFKEDWLVQDWILLVETLLEWEAFMKLDKISISHAKRLKRKHSFIMYLLKKVCRRTVGMGLNTMKFHGILHLASDMLAYGVPSLLDTGSNESHHKPTKAAAKMTQRNVVVFEQQTATRLQEFHLIHLAMAEILLGFNMWEYFALDQERGTPDSVQTGNKADQNRPKNATTGTAIKIFQDDDDGGAQFQLRKNPNKSASWEHSILDYLLELSQHMEESCGVDDIDIRTEHKRSGQIFRGHPNFRGSGQWNDWAVFDWGPRHGKLPGEIWCFVDFSGESDDFQTDFGGCCLTNGVYAVIESTLPCPNRAKDGSSLQNDSDLFTPYIKSVKTLYDDGTIADRQFWLANVEAIVDPLCVIPDVGSEDKCQYFVVAAQNKWSDMFVKWLEAPHKDDEEEMSDEEN